MKTKICKKCGRELPIEEFYKNKNCKDGYRNVCKECFIRQQKQCNKERKEEILEYQKQYYQEHKEEKAEYYKQYYQDNKEEFAEYYQGNKDAIAERQKQYRQEHKEEIAEWQKQYRQDNKEYYTEYQKQYYQGNKEEMLERRKQHYQDNKEYYAEYHKQYYQGNREAILEQKKQYNKTPMGRASYLAHGYRQSDKNANRGECTLTPEWIIDNIFTQPCHWCKKTDWHKIGCDRIDNSLPHTPDNVIPCCEECNKKRGAKTYEEYLLMI